jgi:hypothetical protein
LFKYISNFVNIVQRINIFLHQLYTAFHQMFKPEQYTEIISVMIYMYNVPQVGLADFERYSNLPMKVIPETNCETKLDICAYTFPKLISWKYFLTSFMWRFVNTFPTQPYHVGFFSTTIHAVYKSCQLAVVIMIDW